MRCIIAGVLTSLFISTLAHAGESTLRFLKSQAGPSGKIIDNRFVFDELRNRFVYPQDKSLTVYFEWKAPAGNHILSAMWKDPDGRVASISPDVKMETKTPELHAYWIFELAAGMRSGIWTAEVRVDGAPAGSHSFELVLPEQPRADPSPMPPKLPTLDEIYASAGRSLVWIHKLDQTGRRTDTSLGFVLAKNQVATAFQSIDGALRVELEFNGGRKETTDEVWMCDRQQDWALLKVDTGASPVLERMETGKVPIGERYLVFNVEHEQSRVIGGVDITGRRTVPGFGDRIQIAPSPAREAAGGPLLSPAGLVAGILGGSLTPGSRFSQHDMSVSPALWSRLNAEMSVVPIGSLSKPSGAESINFSTLLEKGVLTPPLSPIPSLVYGGSARSLSKNANDMTTKDASEFSHRDQIVWIYTLWQRKEKVGKGIVSGKVYDSGNRLLVDVAPKKVSLDERVPMRVAFDFASASFPAGIYRVDVLWNSQPAWRTFFTIVD
jgi:hypothetical protein